MRAEQRNQNYSCENHEIVLFDFSAQVCASCYLIAGKMAVGGWASSFSARSNMSGLIEAVSRSVKERCSNQVNNVVRDPEQP